MKATKLAEYLQTVGLSITACTRPLMAWRPLSG